MTVTNCTRKATAGLHHALRSCYSLTYERDRSTAVMHGFVNVSVAAARAPSGASVAHITEARTASSVSCSFREPVEELAPLQPV